MKCTFAGRTGRAQLTVRVPNHQRAQPMFSVRLLPKEAKRNTAFATAGDRAYSGPDWEIARTQIRLWTGLDSVELPRALHRFSRPAAQR